MARRKTWEAVKGEALEAVARERDVGYLDPGIGGYLEALNSIPGIATTSTCIGRVAIVEGVRHWGRGEGEESRIVYKTHGRVRPGDIARAMARGFRYLWLKATGPIIHLRTPLEDCAFHVLSIARESGFKHSGVISRGGPGGLVLELLSAPQLAAPLVWEGAWLVVGEDALGALASAANLVVSEGRERLEEFTRRLSSMPGPCGASSTR